MPKTDLHGARRPQRAIRHRLGEELLVVILGRDVALEEDVDVRVDETRQQSRVAEVDDVRAVGRFAADGDDLVTLDRDRAGRDDRPAAAVDEASGLEVGDRLAEQRNGECEQKEKSSHGAIVSSSLGRAPAASPAPH